MTQALKALNDSVYLVSEYYNEAVELYYNQPSQQINLAALNTDVAAHKAAITALESAIAQPEQPADHIHSCSYFCDKPACIKTQRKELVQQNAELILLLERRKKNAPQEMPAREAVLDLAHRKAWRYKKSSDPAHSDTYTFNEACMLDFVRVITEAAIARPLESKK